MSNSEHHDYHSLTSQVGGHPGLMASEDGSLVIKPAMKAEVDFYQAVQSDPIFEPLRPFLPKFYGTLRLEGQVDQEKSADGAIVMKDGGAGAIHDSEKDEYRQEILSLLENLSHKFLKPNIMDIKLGTVLYEKTATPEKQARMEKTARETTSLETGVRLTGFQVYDIHKNVPVNTPKSYGKSIKPADLPEGIARFFPLADPNPTSSADEAVGTGLPADILLPLLESIHSEIETIKDALEQVPIHMVGGSLLIVYEADWDRAREGVKYWLTERPNDDDEEDDDEEDEEEGEEDSDDGNAKPSPPYLVKLIDFAHTHLTPGEGSDAGVIFGVGTVLELLAGRIEQVKPASGVKS